jgi:hypothetical protein
MTAKAVAGRKGKIHRAFIGGNEFCIRDLDISEVGDEEDTTSTCDAGNDNADIGNTHLEGSFNYQWDVTDNPFDDPPNLDVGQVHGSSKIYVHSTGGAGAEDGPYWGLTMLITRHQCNMPIRGTVNGTVTFRSKGAYTLPTGDDTSSA